MRRSSTPTGAVGQYAQFGTCPDCKSILGWDRSHCYCGRRIKKDCPACKKPYWIWWSDCRACHQRLVPEGPTKKEPPPKKPVQEPKALEPKSTGTTCSEEGVPLPAMCTLIRVQPSEVLEFAAFDSTSKIRLENMTSEKLAFKIKTTAPNDFIVRPNSGFIMPFDKEEVSVAVQKVVTSRKHRFLVWARVVEMPVTDRHKPWEGIDHGKVPADIQQIKLGVRLPESARSRNDYSPQTSAQSDNSAQAQGTVVVEQDGATQWPQWAITVAIVLLTIFILKMLSFVGIVVL